jgi:hypothetical protein
MAAATAFDALDRSQPRASQCGYSLMNLWCGLMSTLDAVDGTSTGIAMCQIACRLMHCECLLLAQSRHSSLCGFMSAFGGKAALFD